MSNEGNDVNFLDVLGQMSAAVCPHCGETTSAYAEVCEACGGSLGIESDDPSLNVTDGSGSHHVGLNKVPMHEAKNLIRLRQALRGLSDGSLSVEDYASVVEDILTLVESALELYASTYMQHRVGNMEPEPAAVYEQLAAAATEMQAGLQGMLRRTIYYDGEYFPYMVLAAISGSLLLIALACFLLNLVMTLGLKGALGIFTKSNAPASEIVPGSDLAVEPVAAVV